MAKKSKVFASTATVSGSMLSGNVERAKNIEEAMVAAIESTVRKEGEPQAQYDGRVRKAIREAVDKARNE